MCGMPLRPSSVIRAVGAGLATALDGHAPRSVRAVLLAGSDVAARRIDPVGLQPLAITPAADLNVLVSVDPDLVTAATGAVSWAGLNLLVAAGVRRLPLPAFVRGLAVGVGVYVADVAVSRAQAHAQAQAASTSP